MKNKNAISRSDLISALQHEIARRDLLLEEFGDDLGEKMKIDQRGFEAICVYLVNKHHWTPATVQAMKLDDIVIALAEERVGWTSKSAIDQSA
jgi:hypothetical protein